MNCKGIYEAKFAIESFTLFSCGRPMIRDYAVMEFVYPVVSSLLLQVLAARRYDRLHSI